MGAQPPRDPSFARFAASDELPPPADALDMPLDKEELDMLAIFHKSFNLPGLRHGLLRPVLATDYYPEEEEEEQPAVQQRRSEPPRARYEEPSAASRLNDLLRNTRNLHLEADGMLNGGGADTVDEEVAEDVVEEEQQLPHQPAEVVFASSASAHQRTVRPRSAASGSRQAAGSRPPSSGSMNGARPRRW